ncbi:MAG TPA: hypothetical protein ENG34_00145 [Candidatus Aenigmarchaeota archaeon]|nr:hypothetical protein [Candidatus Aenigmarchaeota archaeon]
MVKWKKLTENEIANLISKFKALQGFTKIEAWKRDNTIIGYGRYIVREQRHPYAYSIFEIKDNRIEWHSDVYSLPEAKGLISRLRERLN